MAIGIGTLIVLALAGIGLLSVSGNSGGSSVFPYRPVEFNSSEKNWTPYLLLLGVIILIYFYIKKR